MATWLITGATGFLGRHVLEAVEGELEQRARTEDRILVLGRRCPDRWPLDRFLRVDLEDCDLLARTIQTVAPDQVIHTAGRTPPAPEEAIYRGNFWVTIRLLNALRSLGRPVRVTLTGTAAELGPVPTAQLPVAESYSCNPTEAYGRSKWLATIAGLAERPPLEVVVARVFNAIGPGMPTNQAFGDFAAQLGARTPDPLPLIVGNLQVRRDFIDVRDAARALVHLALLGRPGLVYHVGTGASQTVGDGLEKLVRLSGRSVRACVDGRRAARKGPEDSRADIARISAHTGWHPTVPFDQSLADLWDDARVRTEAGASSHAPRLPLTA
jgi:GDP-4-dehydro-6-deoxy-D-mannose reductase